ncbi:hypothetical protein [Erythrobacter sp. JK5]|uniref:hypothetical protein n=1 Tax=Erythrobacter sp. JK5 TaxID=2829500 RepID=UPI001BA4659A|nr:hypothetical protein [Erythrobacter sp. JK5]QUL37214.1 hypothetical protein KDC96_12625 [Erythrobacter sp. JK5]
MRIAKGPRPLSVRLFALAFLIAALAAFAENISDLELAQFNWTVRAPWFAWDRDWTIIASSAELSIAMIPVCWIYVLGSGTARWVVLAFGLVKLLSFQPLLEVWLIAGPINPLWVIEPGLILFALAMLFTPATRSWLDRRDEPDETVFE